MKLLLLLTIQRKSGSALLLTLVTVVLVTLAALAFFAIVSSNTRIQNSRAHYTQAEQLGRTACDYAAGQFLQEITTNVDSTVFANNGAIIYTPIANTNAIPVRIISPAINMSDPDYINLIRQSIPAADANASSDNTASPARNGALVGANQWNEPMLLSGGGFISTNQLPNWIYVDRVKGVTPTASENVIGRFAYNVYDIGGLLNANVAGYPSSVANDAALVARLKNTLAGADLTQLSPNVTQSVVDQLVSFRNPGSWTDTNAYYQSVQNSSLTGFLNPNGAVTNSSGVSFYTNNFFYGRQDLLRYARTQNPPLTNALPYLTTFSRTINSPSWLPLTNYGIANGVNYDYFNNATNNLTSTTSTNCLTANLRFLAATMVRHYNDDGTFEIYATQLGEPFLQRRFSLAKLAWLTHTGLLSGISSDAVQACFGLVWDPTPPQSDPNIPNPSPRWEYVGATGNTIQSSIETLNQVATENREPNFFELLQAGILQGSLGASGHTSLIDTGGGYSEGGVDRDEFNRAYQILRIGANIIDQAREDNYPTAIAFSGTETTDIAPSLPPSTTTVEVWGIKDLPYLNKIIPFVYWSNAPNPSLTAGPVNHYLLFELWNPHQQASASVLNNGPTKFRIRVAADNTDPSSTGPQYLIEYPTEEGFFTYPFGPDPLSLVSDTVNHGALVFTANGLSSDSQQSYREPMLIRTGTASGIDSSGPRVTTTYPPGPPYLDALDLGTSATMSPNPAFGNNVYCLISRAVFVLEYQDPTNLNWYPYTTFVGRPDREGTGLGGDSGTLEGLQAGTTLASQPFSKADPRSFRFDTAWAGTIAAENNWESGGGNNYSEFYPPLFMSGGSAVGTAYMGDLDVNNIPGEFYFDPDNAMRLGDNWNGNGTYSAQNPFLAGNAGPRPILLGRPFQSVGELGYAFRDVAWKTLDFSTASSGDSALLDLFCVHDEPPISAGRVNLNTAQALVRESLLSGFPGIAVPAAVASDYQAYAFSSGVPSATLPQNVAQLANFSYAGTTNSFGSVYFKTQREAVVRAMVESVQTRTWNLLIDVVAQSGRFPGSALSENNFVVEGKKHCWLSIAIDRYTGRIVGQEMEIINE